MLLLKANAVDNSVLCYNFRSHSYNCTVLFATVVIILRASRLQEPLHATSFDISLNCYL